MLENPVHSISSTQLRRLLAFRCAGEFLPKGVEDYILSNGLYDTAADWKNLPMEQLERVVVSLLIAQPGCSCAGMPEYGSGAGQALGR